MDPSVPYLLLMDGNVQEEQSQLIHAIISGSHLINVRADRLPDTADQPTYCKGGIIANLTKGQNGCSNIDYAFTNETGNLMVKSIELLWHECEGLDHVPFQIILNANASQGTHNAIDKGTSINVDNLIELNEHTSEGNAEQLER